MSDPGARRARPLRAMLSVAIGSLAMAVLVGGFSASQAQPIPPQRVQIATAGNLLINPDFEDGYTYPLPCCNNIAVPVGWNIRWYTDTAPVGSPPYNQYKQPEVKIIDNTKWPFCCQLLLPPRIHSGRYAVESFALFADQDTSLYQQVGGIPIGAIVTGSAWVHAWVSSCDPTPSITPVLSLQGPTQGGCVDNYWPIDSNRMMVGIDPTGGVDPRAATVVWNWNPASPPWWGPYDIYSSTQPVVTAAQAHTVTLFLRGVTNQPAKHDNIFFDAASLTYTFPISVGVEQDRPWPLPAAVTIAVQSPVSFTQTAVTVAHESGIGLPPAFAGTSGVSPTFVSRWHFTPTLDGRHTFTLAAFQLPGPLVHAFDVQPLTFRTEQDRLLPPAGEPLTQTVWMTFSLWSPLSLTQVSAVVTDPLGAQQAVTFAGADFVDSTFIFRWRFAPPVAGRHAARIDADEFAWPLERSIFVASTRVYLPIVLRNAAP